MKNPRNVGVLIFEDMETIDMAGPLAVFSIAGRADNLSHFTVYSVAQSRTPVQARSNLTFLPRYSMRDCPPPDILVVPGGLGTRREATNPTLLNWIRRTAEKAMYVLSVCTGSLLLARTGLLDGLTVTTHHKAADLVRQAAPRAEVVVGPRWVDNGHIITSGGLTSGIDAAFYLLSKALGPEEAVKTADYMEYDWRPDDLNYLVKGQDEQRDQPER